MIIAYRVYRIYKAAGLVEQTLGYYMAETDAEQVAQQEIAAHPESAENVLIETIEIK